MQINIPKSKREKCYIVYSVKNDAIALYYTEKQAMQFDDSNRLFFISYQILSLSIIKQSVIVLDTLYL
jgi:hypothetical protein